MFSLKTDEYGSARTEYCEIAKKAADKIWNTMTNLTWKKENTRRVMIYFLKSLRPPFGQYFYYLRYDVNVQHGLRSHLIV